MNRNQDLLELESLSKVTIHMVHILVVKYEKADQQGIMNMHWQHQSERLLKVLLLLLLKFQELFDDAL